MKIYILENCFHMEHQIRSPIYLQPVLFEDQVEEIQIPLRCPLLQMRSKQYNIDVFSDFCYTFEEEYGYHYFGIHFVDFRFLHLYHFLYSL